jgi:hypothetical protein
MAAAESLVQAYACSKRVHCLLQAKLQLMTNSSLLNSTYRIAAVFSTPVAFLNISLIDINQAEVLSVSRQTDDSFVLNCRGFAAGMNASIQLQVRTAMIHN